MAAASTVQPVASIADVLAGRAQWSLVRGDCLDPVAGLPSLPDKCVAHTFADPPYEAEAHSKGRRSRVSVRGAISMVTKAISYEAITEAERTAIAAQIHRITRGWSVTFCQSEAAMLWRAAYEAAGARYVRFGVYWKEDAQPQYSGDRPGVGWEAVVIHWHGEKRTSWNGGGRSAIWKATRDSHGVKALVDGQKPLALLVEMISDFTDEGDVICSPYGGAGTEVLAALRLGRRGFCFEKKPEHADVIEARLSTGDARPAPGQLSLLERAGKVVAL